MAEELARREQVAPAAHAVSQGLVCLVAVEDTLGRNQPRGFKGWPFFLQPGFGGRERLEVAFVRGAKEAHFAGFELAFAFPALETFGLTVLVELRLETHGHHRVQAADGSTARASRPAPAP